MQNAFIFIGEEMLKNPSWSPKPVPKMIRLTAIYIFTTPFVWEIVDGFSSAGDPVAGRKLNLTSVSEGSRGVGRGV